jgi:hypothetical protein
MFRWATDNSGKQKKRRKSLFKLLINDGLGEFSLQKYKISAEGSVIGF